MVSVSRDAAPAEAARRCTATWQEVAAEAPLGAAVTRDVELSDDQLRDLYRLMAVGRRVDTQAITLTRQGALGVYASSRGQEASQVAPVFALGAEDWMFPTYRETVATFARGVPVEDILALFSGSWHCGFDPTRYRVGALSTPLATQALHAVGLAAAARLRGDRVAALAFFGDGAASEGDVHEAMNLAAVWQAPCVFLVQNNQYAISVPLRLQMRTSSLALRATGYGMPGIRVDGNDAVSVYGAVRAALDRAHDGGGPTFIEAMTYRMEAHTTADDQNRYRSADEVAQWSERDPLPRLLAVLRERGIAGDAYLAEVDAEAERVAARMRDTLYGAEPGDPREIFEHAYAEPTPRLREQRAQLQAELDAEREAR